MSLSFTPYLMFRGQARDAMEFYQSIFGGDLNVLTFEQGGMTEGVDPAQVMHSQLDGTVRIMGADVPESMELSTGSRISLCFAGDEAGLETGREYFAKLGAGGAVNMPLDKAPWGDYYGDLTDKYGINWMFDFGSGSSEQPV